MGIRFEGSRIIFTPEAKGGITRRDFLKATVAAGLAIPESFGTLSITGQTIALNDEKSLIGMDVSHYLLPGDIRDARPVVDLTELAPGENQTAYLVADARVNGVREPVIGAYGVLTDQGGMVVPIGRDGMLDMAVFEDRLKYPRGDRRIRGFGVAREIVMIYEKEAGGVVRAEATRPLPNGEWKSADFNYKLGELRPDFSNLRFKSRRGYEVGQGLTAFNF